VLSKQQNQASQVKVKRNGTESDQKTGNKIPFGFLNNGEVLINSMDAMRDEAHKTQ